MKTLSQNQFKQEAFKVHAYLISKGMFKEAGRLYRALLNGVCHIHIGLGDTDWSLSDAYGLPGAYTIRIR